MSKQNVSGWEENRYSEAADRGAQSNNSQSLGDLSYREDKS